MHQGVKDSNEGFFQVQGSKVGGGRRDIRQEIVWVVNHWMNWNNRLIYEVEVLNQTSTRTLTHRKDGSVVG